METTRVNDKDAGVAFVGRVLEHAVDGLDAEAVQEDRRAPYRGVGEGNGVVAGGGEESRRAVPGPIAVRGIPPILPFRLSRGGAVDGDAQAVVGELALPGQEREVGVTAAEIDRLADARPRRQVKLVGRGLGLCRIGDRGGVGLDEPQAVRLAQYVKSTGPKLWLPAVTSVNVELFGEETEPLTVMPDPVESVVLSVYHLSDPLVS